MISRVKRYFLEIKDFSNPIELNIPQDYQIILDEKKDFKLKTDISLLSAKATAEGPFYNGAWLISGRRTYFDKIAEVF